MAKLLLAWELGGGLGHASRLHTLAAEMQHRGHRASFMLRDLVQTDGLLRGLRCDRLQAPLWTFRTVGLPEPPLTLAEILLGSGYLRAAHLRAQVEGWLSALRLTSAQCVVADYAPTAVLAARIAGLPCATLGAGFWMPPAGVPLPLFRHDLPVAPGRIEAAEAQLLANVNKVLTEFGNAPWATPLPLFQGDLPLLCTWPELDHFQRGALPAGQRWHGPSLGAGLGSEAGGPVLWPSGSGPRVFAYLKAAHPGHAQLLAALVQAGCRTLCYLPEVAAGMAPPVLSPAIRYAAAPVSLNAALASSELVVCHGGTATVAQAGLAGVPVLVLPMQPEQALLAQCVERGGLGLSAAADASVQQCAALVQRLLADATFALRGREFAACHAGFTPHGQTVELCDAIESLVA